MRQTMHKINEVLLSGAVATQVSVGARAERIADSPRTNGRVVALSVMAGAAAIPAASYAGGAAAPTGSTSTNTCTGSAASGLVGLIKSAAGFMIALGAAGALLMLAIGAALIIFGGTPDRVSKGMKMIKNVVIGLAILATGAFLRYVVVDFVGGATGQDTGVNSCLSSYSSTTNGGL